MSHVQDCKWESCFNVFDAGAQTALLCDDEDWYLAFFLTRSQEKWSHIPGERDLSTLVTAIIPAPFCLLLQNCPAYRKASLCNMSDRSYNSKMHFSTSSQIIRGVIFLFIFYMTLGALTAAWLLLPSEAVTFPLEELQWGPARAHLLWLKSLEHRRCFNFCFILELSYDCSLYAWLILFLK